MKINTYTKEELPTISIDGLRIGNWVFYRRMTGDLDGNTYFIYNPVQIYQELFGHPFSTGITGIPITHEILELAGFELNTLEMFGDIEPFYFHKKYSLHFHAGSFLIEDSNSESDSQSLHNILYLHQLQNDYFTITGNELEINLLSSVAS
jgi:hypothetical protein